MRAIGSGNEDEGAYLNVRRSNLQDKAGVREWEGFRRTLPSSFSTWGFKGGLIKEGSATGEDSFCLC